MAHSYYCVHCGYQETTHEEAESFPEKIPGMRFSAVDCPGFEMSRSDIIAQQKEKDAEWGKKNHEHINHSVYVLTPNGVLDIGG